MDKGAVHINDDPAFQRRFWIAQRIAWLVLAGLLVAALAGLTGSSGPLSQGRVGDESFSISYPLFARRQAQDVLEITVHGDREATMVHFEQAFLDNFNIVDMSPVPANQIATAWGQSYRFLLAGEGDHTIRLAILPDETGRSNYAVVVDGHMALLSTFVLP